MADDPEPEPAAELESQAVETPKVLRADGRDVSFTPIGREQKGKKTLFAGPGFVDRPDRGRIDDHALQAKSLNAQHLGRNIRVGGIRNPPSLDDESGRVDAEPLSVLKRGSSPLVRDEAACQETVEDTLTHHRHCTPSLPDGEGLAGNARSGYGARVVAGNVVLDREEVRSILSLYHLEDLEDFGGNNDTAIHTSYWVKAGGRRYDLRITERKTLDDMVYEKDLLIQLKQAGVPVPILVRNVARGTFTPWARRGRYISLFEHMPGRPLGIFEVRARHTRIIGRVLGEMHRAAAGFRRRRSTPWSLATLLDKLGRLERALDRRRLALRFAPAVKAFREELRRQEERLTKSIVPMGAVHGHVSVSRARFGSDDLVGLIEFESACRDRLILDLAIAVSEWGWEPSPKQRGGPAGRFRVAKVRALIEGYQRNRVLSTSERDELADELRFVAAREGIKRLITHDLSRVGRDGSRVYKDHRHYLARLEALSQSRAEQLVERALRS